MAVKKRAKVRIGVGTGVAVALLVARSVMLRPVPFQFLQDAEYQGTHVVDSMSGFHPPMPPQLEEVQEYRIVQPWERVLEGADLELTTESGWTCDQAVDGAVFRKGEETVVMLFRERSRIGKRDIVEISVFRPAPSVDRFVHSMQYQLRLARRRHGGS